MGSSLARRNARPIICVRVTFNFHTRMMLHLGAAQSVRKSIAPGWSVLIASKRGTSGSGNTGQLGPSHMNQTPGKGTIRAQPRSHPKNVIQDTPKTILP